MNNFKDFAQKHHAEGVKIKIEEVLNKEIIVVGFEILKSKFKPEDDCLKLQIELNNENRVIFTGSSVLTKQCKEYESNMPFKTSIIKGDSKYFTFS